MYVTAGEGLSLQIEFKVGGDFVVPDANTVKISIRNQSGGLVSGWNQQAVNHAGLTQYPLVIPADVNTAAGREKRSIIVDFKVGGGSHRQIIHYFVTPWLNVTVTPVDVRRFFGVSEVDLPDTDVSVEEAYYGLLQTYDKIDIDAALVDVDMMIYANNLVLANACLSVIHSMQVRLKKSETSDDESYIREKIDWASFIPQLQAMATSAADVIFEREEVNLVHFDKVTPTDVITGV